MKSLNKYELCRTHNIRLIRVSEFELPKDDYCDLLIVRSDPNSNASLEDCIDQLFVALGSTDAPESNLLRDNTEIISQYYTSLKNNSLQTIYPKIAEEWDYENNHGVTPEMVSAYSSKCFFWKCKNNHSFKKAVYERTRTDGKATGCPYCSNKVVLEGYNDLISSHPEIKEEWDYEKNRDLSPSKVLSGSAKKAWWICPKGHSYYQSICNHVLMHQGCPICAGKIATPGDNDFGAIKPELLKEWDYERNGGISPELLTYGSSKKVWWLCPKGHSYNSSIYSRVKINSGCPYCMDRKVLKGFNDLATIAPSTAQEWDYEKNTCCSPDEVTFGSCKYVWWKCSICGTSWKASIVNRTKNHSGCPKCARKNITKKLQQKVICIETKRVFNSASEAASWLGVSRSLISMCARGTIKHARGLHWKYYTEDLEKDE